MPEQGKTSVVIPFFNDADVISRTLDSIREQSCIPLEVIISDDLSSPDEWGKMLSICKRYPELQIRCLRGEVNTGPGLARARAISVADGTYIAFCDADDLFLRNRIQESESLLEEGCDFVWSSSYREENGVRFLIDRKKYIHSNKRIEAYIVVGRINKFTSTISCKTEVLRAFDFRMDLKYYEDFYTLLQAYSRCKTCYLEEPTAVKVDRLVSYSSAKKGRVLFQKIRARLLLNKLLIMNSGYSPLSILRWNLSRIFGVI